jgi:hypothetical protein
LLVLADAYRRNATSHAMSDGEKASSIASIARAGLVGVMAAAIAAMPLTVTWQGWQLGLAWQDAAAKDGHGHGGGNGNGSGGGKGNGGKGQGKGKAGASPGQRARGSVRQVTPATGDSFVIGGGTIEVVHRNGMRERIRSGRYLMKDGKGRTIIERAATKADLSRLRDLQG